MKKNHMVQTDKITKLQVLHQPKILSNEKAYQKQNYTVSKVNTETIKMITSDECQKSEVVLMVVL